MTATAAARAAEAWVPHDESHREWAELTARAPQLAATMRRYLVQLSTFLAPASVAVADHTLRQLARWLTTTTEVTIVADISRTHVEDYKVWLAAQPGAKGPTLSKNTQRQPFSAPKRAMIEPPTTGPTAVDSDTVVPNRPNALPRSAPLNSSWINPVFCGVSMPAAMPCNSRAATSIVSLTAAPASALVNTNADSANRNIRRLPSTSPSLPPDTSTSPNVSA